MINQIAVFLENRVGRSYDFARVLADAGIDLVSMSIADTREFGILRAVTSDNKRAVSALKAAGFVVTATDLIGVIVEDHAGGLADVLKCFAENDVDIEYLYSYAHGDKGTALILIKANDIQKADTVINNYGIKTV